MNVFELDRALVERYASFARSFSSIRAREIEGQISHLYQTGKFWPDPLIAINPRFEAGERIDQLAGAGALEPETARVFAFGAEKTPMQLHRHQERAVLKAGQGESFVVTTGTGSGKSMCFFIPIVDAIIKARKAGEAPRTRAIIIYPMNALANSQMGEILKFLAESGLDSRLCPTIARYTGQESEEERERIRREKPDILLTNFMMLELLLTRQEKLDRDVIGNATGFQFLVLDELHTYRGRQGADVAMLVRRLKQRLSADRRVICIGTSATMSSAADERDRDTTVAEVATKIFGQPISYVNVIGENLARATSTDIQLAQMGEALRASVLEPLPEALTDKALQTHPLACWIETEIGLEEGEKLRRRMPMTLPQAAAKLAGQTGLPENTCSDAIAAMLGMMGRREDERGGSSPRAFLAFKLHRFISGAGQAYATLEPPASRRVTLEGQKFHPDDPSARLYPLFFCRDCGQEHHSVTMTPEEGGVRFIARPIDDPARDEPEDDGSMAGYLVPAVNPDFSFGGSFGEYPEDWLETTRSGDQRLKANYRDRKGVHYSLGLDGKVAKDGAPVWFFPGKFRFCCQCGYQAPLQSREVNKLAGLSAEGRSSATTLIVSSILTWMERDGSLAPHTRKILGFTDNRQDAALQAGHFNDFIFVSLLRGAILKAVREAGPGGLRPEHFGEAVRLALGFDLEHKDRLDEWMLDPDVKGYQNRQEAQESLTAVLAHRLWADLRRGWRFTNPNLEDVGLIGTHFPGLDELVSDEDVFVGNPKLAGASHEVRRTLFAILFDHMRQGLAVSTDALIREKVKQAAETSRHRLRHPWAIDGEEEASLRESGFLMPEPPGKNSTRPTEEVLILRAGPTSKVGKALRRSELWGETLSPNDYRDLIRALLSAAEAHQVVKKVETGFGSPGWRLSPTAIRLVPRDVRADGRRHNEFFRGLYEQVSELLGHEGSLPYSFEAREHTAQVDQDVRGWREDRFRFEEPDQGRIKENLDQMRQRGEPETFLPALFCSPTMELGVDISALNAVYMRNVPPTPANYAQRSGRAGRSGQAALVLVYCAALSPHDQYYFNEPTALVAGAVRPPALDLANQDLLRSHLHAEWLAAASAPIKTAIPENLQMEASGMPLTEELTVPLKRLMESGAARPIMRQLIDSMMSTVSLADAPWLEDVERFVVDTETEAFSSLNSAFDRWRGLYLGARQEQSLAHATLQKPGLELAVRRDASRRYAAASREIEILESGRATSGSDFWTYRYLATEGFLPGYNFPRLPLYAVIPSEKRGAVLQRPRFLAISEFGPNSLVYHEGRAFRVTKAKLPINAKQGSGQLATTTLVLCPRCGAAHTEEAQERCHACGTSLTAAERLQSVFRVDNVETSPSERITANDEERQRRGFEIQTVFQWPMRNGAPDIRSIWMEYGEERLLRLDYGAAARLSRLNKGLKRRKIPAICGFFIDPDTGRWIKDPKNGSEDDGMGDPTGAKAQRIVPMVEDRKNAIVLTPGLPMSASEMATLQHALARGIQLVFELEEGEILGDPLPSREDRNVILLYEAMEGGAGVLNRLISEPDKVREVARRALELMHYTSPFDPDDMAQTEDACVAGCYRCVLSYFNQPDHELIDRRSRTVFRFLCSLAEATVAEESDDGPTGHPWLDAIQRWGLPKPRPIDFQGGTERLFWPGKNVLALCYPISAEDREFAEDIGITELLQLPEAPGEEPPPELLAALGVQS